MTQRKLEFRDYNYELSEDDVCSDVQCEMADGSQYICDLISERSDSCVDIYNADLWNKASDFQEWIEEAIDQGLCDTSSGKADLIKMFMAGQYEYYTQMCYNNEQTMYYNTLVEIYNEQEGRARELLDAVEDIEDKLEDIAGYIDNNDRCDIFREKFDEWVEELISDNEEEEEEEEEEDV